MNNNIKGDLKMSYVKPMKMIKFNKKDENRFEKVGDLAVKLYFLGECEMDDLDAQTLKGIAFFLNKLADGNLNEQDFNILRCYGKFLERREAGL